MTGSNDQQAERITIESMPGTIKLKERLYQIRNEILDHLVTHQPDQKVDCLLDEAERKIRAWAAVHYDFLARDDEYYLQVTHNILMPVSLTISQMNGEFYELEGERDQLLKKLQSLTQPYSSQAV